MKKQAKRFFKKGFTFNLFNLSWTTKDDGSVKMKKVTGPWNLFTIWKRKPKVEKAQDKSPKNRQ